MHGPVDNHTVLATRSSSTTSRQTTAVAIMGYNASDGVFTAPEPGTYLFMATARHSLNGTSAQVYLMVNGSNDWAWTYAPESSIAHAAVSLSKGDQVWVQAYNSFTPKTNYYTFFTGAMISN
jgi:hypothetical protein